MNIVIGSDHGGFDLKLILVEYLKGLNHDVTDAGTFSKDACDYPDFAFKVAEHVAANPGTLGIMIDGAGIGSSMCANRVPGVLAAVCNELYVTRNSREHNGANVMCLGSQVVGPGLAKKLVDTFIETKFEGGRHVKRVDKILGYSASAVAVTENLIKTVVARVISLVRGGQAAEGLKPSAPALVTDEYAVNNCPAGTTVTFAKGTIITSLAQDRLRAKGVTVRFE